MFAVSRTDGRGDTLVAIRATEAECRVAICVDALIRLAQTMPTLRQKAMDIGSGRRLSNEMSPEEREALDREFPKYSIARIG